MARRGGAAAPAEETGGGGDLASEVESLAPTDSRFSDPVRADAPEPGEPPSQPSTTPSPAPDLPAGGGVGAGAQPSAPAAPEFDVRAEVEQLQRALAFQQQRSGMLERELQFRAAAAQQQAAAAQPQQQVDPVLQEVLDILQVSEEDLIEVFQGGEKGAQIVTRALQATALLAIQAAERRLVQYYQRDQGQRQQAQFVEQRAGQMHEAFWTNYPELADHAIIVQHYAAEVAAEQANAPRFDWESAQQEVARRTLIHLRQVYNTNVQVAQPIAGGGYAPRPTLQSRLRPAFGEMGTGGGRPTTPTAQAQLTAEILDLAR